MRVPVITIDFQEDDMADQESSKVVIHPHEGVTIPENPHFWAVEVRFIADLTSLLKEYKGEIPKPHELDPES